MSPPSGQIFVVTEEEQNIREDMSLAHWLTRFYKMDELTWNHISAKLSDGTMLITPGDRLFDDISPQDLRKSGSKNVTADIIHASVYEGRSDVKCVIHLHTPATVAISCLKQGFKCIAQESALFHNKVVYLMVLMTKAFGYRRSFKTVHLGVMDFQMC